MNLIEQTAQDILQNALVTSLTTETEQNDLEAALRDMVNKIEARVLKEVSYYDDRGYLMSTRFDIAEEGFKAVFAEIRGDE